MDWQLQHAKNRLSEVIRLAQADAAQIITVRGEEAAVVISTQRYRQLLGRTDSLAEFMQRSPWADTQLNLERSEDTGRDIEL